MSTTVVTGLSRNHQSKYVGASFLIGKKGETIARWRAQLRRMGLTLHLGTFNTADEACRAYDNASYYTREWSKNHPDYNFPEEWLDSVKNKPEPTRPTMVALGRLKNKFPDFLAEQEATKNMDPLESLQYEGLKALDQLEANVQKYRAAFGAALGEVRLLRAEIKQRDEKITILTRTVAAQEAAGGKVIFNRPGTQPTQRVESTVTNLSEILG